MSQSSGTDPHVSDPHGSDLHGSDLHGTGPAVPADGPAHEVVLSQEQLRVGTTTERAGVARALKRIEVEDVSHRVERGREQVETERVEVDDVEADSGRVETLPDGSLSIPVFEEQVVVTKRLVVRERVVLRKHTVYEEQQITEQVRRERLDVQTEGEVVVTDEGQVQP